MSDYYPVPHGACDICGRPLEYYPNPNWENLKALFRLNPSLGYWLPKDHPECAKNSAKSAISHKESKARLDKDAEIKRALRELGFPQIQVDKPFEKFTVQPANRRAYETLQKWNYSKIGVLLYGAPGRGKSHLMAAFGKQWMEAGMTVAFNTMSGLLALLRRGYDEEMFSQRLKFVSGQVPILILDDLGAEKTTEWSAEMLYSIVNTRLETGLPLFVTTNCSESELEKKFHARIVSRLKEMCSWVEVGGSDWRNHIHNLREAGGPGGPLGQPPRR